MIFRWWKNRRRAVVAKQAFPAEWNDIIASNVLHDQHLSRPQKAQLRKFVQVFISEKYWEGCDGQTITDEVKVTIAAQAGLLTLGRPDVWFDNTLSILVYPDEFVAKDIDGADGLVTETQQLQLGEAVWQGPVILSWKDSLSGGRREDHAHNLVLHEFAHQLDMMNGPLVDGVPPLNSQAELNEWVSVMQEAFLDLNRNCHSGQQTAMDCYGAQNPTEFFSVATEAFFENGRQLRNEFAAVYGLLRRYYAVDPASWDKPA